MEKASSGLGENFILPKHLVTIDDTSLCFMYTGAKKGEWGELAPPR